MYSDINPPDIILMKKHMFEGGFKMLQIVNYFFKVGGVSKQVDHSSVYMWMEMTQFPCFYFSASKRQILELHILQVHFHFWSVERADCG